jgi:hypothetical protein
MRENGGKLFFIQDGFARGQNTSRETRNCTRISSYFMALSSFGSMARISAITRSIVRGGRPFRLPPALPIGMAGT